MLENNNNYINVTLGLTSMVILMLAVYYLLVQDWTLLVLLCACENTCSPHCSQYTLLVRGNIFSSSSFYYNISASEEVSPNEWRKVSLFFTIKSSSTWLVVIKTINWLQRQSCCIVCRHDQSCHAVVFTLFNVTFHYSASFSTQQRRLRWYRWWRWK